MYVVDASKAHELLTYSDIYSGALPNLKKEIEKLNMHKAVSIICELIRVRDVKLDFIDPCLGVYTLPFETILKIKFCGIVPKTIKEMFSNPLLRYNKRIISLQMLLILLKKLIKYGKYETMEYMGYEVTNDDYRKIIQLQLVVAEEVDKKNLKEFDVNHFLYSTYHLNFQRSLKYKFLRMYYMMEKLSRDKTKFDVDVQKEYRDYYTVFTNQYGYSPTQYSSLLFGGFNTYFGINKLIYTSMWKNIEEVCGKIKEKDLISQVINTLAQPIEKFSDWATETEEQEWDFSKFFEFPFIKDRDEHYISISEITLGNAFFEKIFWLIRDCYSQNDSRAMAFFGRLFEKYIQDITEHTVKPDYSYIPEFSSVINKKEKKSSDAYIIAVTMDNINEVPQYYNRIHEKIETDKKCSRTKFYFNFNIEEYEMLMCVLEKGHDIFSLLESYNNNKCLQPFNTYMLEQYPDISMTSFMKEIYHEATESMKEIVLPD